MWIQWNSFRPRRAAPGLLGLLLAPFVALGMLLVFLAVLPAAVVLYFWSRHKFKKMFRSWEVEEQGTQGEPSTFVDSYVVETGEKERASLPGREVED